MSLYPKSPSLPPSLRIRKCKKKSPTDNFHLIEYVYCPNYMQIIELNSNPGSIFVSATIYRVIVSDAINFTLISQLLPRKCNNNKNQNSQHNQIRPTSSIQSFHKKIQFEWDTCHVQQTPRSTTLFFLFAFMQVKSSKVK